MRTRNKITLCFASFLLGESLVLVFVCISICTVKDKDNCVKRAYAARVVRIRGEIFKQWRDRCSHLLRKSGLKKLCEYRRSRTSHMAAEMHSCSQRPTTTTTACSCNLVYFFAISQQSLSMRVVPTCSNRQNCI